VPEGRHMAAPRIAQRRHESGTRAPARPQSPPGSCPKSICSCRPGGVSNRTVAFASAVSSRRNGATAHSTVRRLTSIDRSRSRSLAYHLRIAAVPQEALLQPRLLLLELAAAGPPLVRDPTLGCHVAPHRALAAPELPRNALQPTNRACRCSIASTSSEFIIVCARGLPTHGTTSSRLVIWLIPPGTRGRFRCRLTV
jgi:hypothetical protein